jgi:glycosyltransferase involved in cell wall biosynthesis
VAIQKQAKNNHDITKYLFKKYLNEFSNKVAEYSKKADLVILDHASATPFIKDVPEDVPIIYNSHNSEITMAKQVYNSDAYVTDIVEKIESLALKRSVAMTYCSQKDMLEIEKYYDLVPANTMYIPNGTIMQEKTDPATRMQSKNIIFVGSSHPPNVIAANNVIKVAKLAPEYDFILCGGASRSVNQKELPSNVKVLGFVAEEKLHELFKESFAFINPMESGSGTHLKVMKALSYGIPILTSVTGARGFSEDEIKNTMVVAESSEDFISGIEKLQNKKVYNSLSSNGHSLSKKFDWEVIKKDYQTFINSVLSNKTVKIITNAKTKKEKVLIYSIVRNIESRFDQYHFQIKKIVKLIIDERNYW